MTAGFWAMIVVCHGLAGGDCRTHYAPGPLIGLDCANTVVALKGLWDTDKGWCSETRPAGSTPLPVSEPPDVVGGAQHADVEMPACDRHETITGVLTQRFGEKPVWAGIIGSERKAVMELYQGESTWTLLRTDTAGQSCILSAGKGSTGGVTTGERGA